MIDVTASFGIHERYAWLLIEMARKISKLVVKCFKDRRVDLYSGYVPCTEKECGKNVTAATYANYSDLGWCLHEVSSIDDIVFQIGELTNITVQSGYRRGGRRGNVGNALAYFGFGRMGD